MDFSVTKSLEYQKYLAEMDLFLKSRNAFLEKKRGSYIYIINKEGFIKKNKETGKVVLQIVPPEYLDYEKIMQDLHDKNKKCLYKIKKIRDKIINGNSEPEDINLFEEGKQEYLEIKEKIENFRVLGEKMYNISENKEKINKLIIELEKLENDQRQKFNELKIIDYKSSIWGNTARKYCLFMKENERKKNVIQNQINQLTLDREIEKKDQKNNLIIIKKKKNQLYSGAPVVNKEVIVPYKKKTIKKKNQPEDYIIFFNSRIKKHNFLSNFFKRDFTLSYYKKTSEEHSWKSVEHYFQAMKFSEDKGDNLKYLLKVKNSNTPSEAKKLGGKRRVKNVSIRDDWNKLSDGKIGEIDLKVKDLIMLEALNAKFKQNTDLRNKLIETGNIKLVELSKNDMYWGSNKENKGKNMLGELLMYIRKNIILFDVKSKKKIKNDNGDEKSEDTSGGYRENNVIKSILTKKKSIKKRVTWDNENVKEKQTYNLNDNITIIPLKSLNIEELNDDGNHNNEINTEEKDILEELNNVNTYNKELNTSKNNNKEQNIPANLNLIENILSNKNIKNINIKMSNNPIPSENIVDKKHTDINQLDLIENLNNVSNDGNLLDSNEKVKDNGEKINFLNILDTENINDLV
jgi:N-glycosidase YbiA